ncbi:helix-turn-helix domain-containing protein [Nocardiopsis changdeensis]|uniref:Helix-turn-helix transcriptional regulator n=1 Tax=Nocardiopsis changdeensis TaxID=2831969 RepID=A0A975KUG5_9ACTN|nr:MULTISPECIES: helix-turn-helix transcriptional regulator [Nocardiopsis]QUX26478.1 helix-turn-helix transcriptional regulator [Nocardiopsis changdeensis]QYX40750.1 helix-turn-helix transcriptional regulator [Nocardiopsis sp. MT53]
MAREKTAVDELALSRFADELRARRVSAGLSQTELGQLAGYSRQAVGEVERLRQPPTRKLAEALDKALEARGELLALLPRRGVPERGRLMIGYVPLERQATSLDQFHAQVVPALLQTEDYARADLAGTVPPQPSSVLDEWLRTRMERQRVRRKHPLAAQFVIDEGALRRQIGGPEVMAAQYKHILSQMDDPFVTVQVLPFSAGAHPAQHGACTILHLEGPHAEPVLYVETMAGSQIVAEPTVVAQAARRFAALRGIALSPAHSREYIRALATSEH